MHSSAWSAPLNPPAAWSGCDCRDLLRTLSGAEMCLVVSAGTVGLACNPASGWRAVPPAAIFVLFNILLASGARSLIERLLSRRRIRELLVFVLLMMWMVPRFLFLT